jgi:hypothetical protein
LSELRPQFLKEEFEHATPAADDLVALITHKRLKRDGSELFGSALPSPAVVGIQVLARARGEIVLPSRTTLFGAGMQTSGPLRHILR